MTLASSQLDLSLLISSALTYAEGSTQDGSQREFYLIFKSGEVVWSDESLTVSNTSPLFSLAESRDNVKKVGDREELARDLSKGLRWFGDRSLKEIDLELNKMALQLKSSRFRFQRTSWRAFLVDPRVHQKLIGVESTSRIHCVVRLMKIPSIAFPEEAERRIKSLLMSDGDMLILVNKREDLVGFSEWMLSTDVLEFSQETSQMVLPRGWRWLYLDQIQYRSRPHWGNPVSCLRLSAEIKGDPSANIDHNDFAQFSWLVTFQGGELRHAMRLNGQWHFLDQLNFEEWRETTQLSLVSEELTATDSSVSHAVKSQREDGLPFIVDYEEVLSGLGSEASTLHQDPAHFTKPAMDVSYSEQLTHQEGTAAFSSAQVETHQEFDQTEAIEDQQEEDEEHFNEFDQSAVLDISLSEIPIVPAELGKSLTETSLEGEVDEGESRAFQEVREILSSGNSLRLNRSVVTSLSSGGDSLVTSQQQSEGVSDEEDDFSYHTLNQRSPQGDIPTFNERLNSREQTVSSNFVDREATAEITSEFATDLDSLPTRIDLHTEAVIGALDLERQETVTRVVNDSDTLNAPKIEPQVPSLAGNIPLGNEATKIEERSSSQEPSIHSVSDAHRVESFSKNETAKLRVRDFDMLTDIKELPSRPHPPRVPRTEPKMSAPPVPSSPPHYTSPPAASSAPPPLPPVSQSPRPQAPPPPHLFSKSPPSSPAGQVSNAKRSTQESVQQSKTHRDRRSFSDVIRSLTAKNKTPK